MLLVAFALLLTPFSSKRKKLDSKVKYLRTWGFNLSDIFSILFYDYQRYAKRTRTAPMTSAVLNRISEEERDK